MTNTRLNHRSDILVVALPSVYNKRWICSMKGEKERIYSDYTGGWTKSKSLSEYRERYPFLPEGIADNLKNSKVNISIVSWELIERSPRDSKWLIDNAARYGQTNDYDLSRIMRRRNSVQMPTLMQVSYGN